MKNTKQRIAEYKEKLPKVKEKFIAMIALLIVSASMLTTVSFAWVLLSVNPEVTGITTAVAANGNLEIALASGVAAMPGVTQLGDGNKDIVEKNITWGNLINLSDPSYGLSNMVLRPALLNTSDLSGSPLRAAVYSDDGRFESMAADFGFAKWQTYNDGRKNEFVLTDEYGLRAITSTIVKQGQAVSIFETKSKSYLEQLSTLHQSTTGMYLAIMDNDTYMKSLANIVTVYVQLQVNEKLGGDTTEKLDNKDVENLYYIFLAFKDVLKEEQAYMTALANYQIYLQQSPYEAEEIDFEQLQSMSAGKGKDAFATEMDAYVKEGTPPKVQLMIKGLQENIKAMESVDACIAVLEQKIGKQTVWTDLDDEVIYKLMNVPSCTLNDTPISQMASDIGGALSSLGGKDNRIVITNGVLKDYEKRTGAQMSPYIEIKVKLGFTSTIGGTVTTNAHPLNVVYQYVENEQHTNNNLYPKGMTNNGSLPAQRQPDQTYGFAIDFWVRTNAKDSYLILEGNVKTEPRYEDAKGKDSNGNEVQLYTVNEKTGVMVGGNETEATHDVYYRVVIGNFESGIFTADENGTYEKIEWRYHENHSTLAYCQIREATGEATPSGTWYSIDKDGSYTQETPNSEPIFKINEYQVVVGYEGENRVWDEESSSLISINATTQGSGSCYVFYANTPEDQERGLDLLSAIRVAFVQGNDLLTQAYLDTEHFYADDGKITVPLVLENNSISFTEKNGEERLAIMQMPKNEAELITAIVYLDGQQVTNEDVLATSNIDGQFNIQFGNAWSQSAASNDKLESEELIVSASVDVNSFDYATATDMTTTVTANISGVEPNSVKAFFIRTITATQGVPESKAFSFTKQSDGVWVAEHTFTSPGNYVLRSIQVDGVEYDLPKNKRPTVEIAGFAVTSLDWDAPSSTSRFMTSSSVESVELWTQFGTTADKQPKTVVGQFHEVNGERTSSVQFNYDVTSTTWTGRANFSTSGEYVLDMLIIDGEYFPLAENFQKTAEVIVGMRVAIYSNSPREFVYGLNDAGQPGMEANKEKLQMQLEILDDNGKNIEALDGVRLYYGTNGTAASGWDIDVDWNYDSKYYEGEFLSVPGTYGFVRLMIFTDNGVNTINVATTAPTFNIISLDPPSVDVEADTVASDRYQYTQDAEGVLKLPLKDTNKQTGVWAVVQKQDADGNWVTYENGDNGRVAGSLATGDDLSQTWHFLVDGTGTYRIVSAEFTNVYVDGEMIPKDSKNPYIIDMLRNGEPKPEYTSTIARTVATILNQVDIKANDIIFGMENGTVTAEFMTQHNLNDKEWSIVVTDDLGSEIPNVKTIRLTFEYGFEHNEFGGYDVAKSDISAKIGPGNTVSMILTNSGDGKTFVLNSDAVLSFAGTYKLIKVEFETSVVDPNKNENVTQSIVLNRDNGVFKTEYQGDLAMTMSVYSKKPTVTITAISNPTGTFSVDTNTSGKIEDSMGTESRSSRPKYRAYYNTNSAHKANYSNSISATAATVYFVCDHTNSSAYGYTNWQYTNVLAQLAAADNRDYHHYTQPTVTITLSGYGNAAGAALNFAPATDGADVHLYTGAGTSGKTTGYSWTADGEVMRYVGAYTQEESWGTRVDDSKTAAGKLTATQLVLTDSNGIEFYVTVSITIDNPC